MKQNPFGTGCQKFAKVILQKLALLSKEVNQLRKHLRKLLQLLCFLL